MSLADDNWLVKAAEAFALAARVVPASERVATYSIAATLYRGEKLATIAFDDEIEHPFRKYWASRVGGAAAGAVAGAGVAAIAGRSGLGLIPGALAGAFVGEKGGEIKSVVDHGRAVDRLEAEGMPIPDPVRYHHLYGPAAHHAAVRGMKSQIAASRAMLAAQSQM